MAPSVPHLLVDTVGSDRDPATTVAETPLTPAQIRAAKTRSSTIDREIAKARKVEETMIRLLLLGTAESGKSTVLKQLKLIHHGNLNDRDSSTGATLSSATNAMSGSPTLGDGLPMDAMTWKNVIRSNLADSLHLVLANVGVHGNGLRSDAAKVAAKTVMENSEALKNSSETEFESLRGPLSTVLEDKGFKLAMSCGAKFNLLDSGPKFIQNALNIIDAQYQPSNEEILLARLPTTSITETLLDIQGNPFKVYDVNGSAKGRSAWIPFFDHCHAIVFVAAISSFDQPLPDDPFINKLMDSMMVFEKVINHPLMKKSAFMLFLNKIDLLKEKLASGASVHEAFPDYGGSNEYEEVSVFFAQRFASLKKNPKVKAYVHFTWATQTSQIKTVLKLMHHTIIQLNLETAGLTV
ncbi:guanine nucleotide binding protein, alpha subunit [Blastocladiella britannica]|nr:guanine nucleotide binding protein, alpha subunit [Blastocladiella britannica]